MKIEKRVLGIEYDGQSFEIAYPTVKKFKVYQEELDKLGEKPNELQSFELVQKFLDSLGLPMQVSDELEPATVGDIMSQLTGSKKKVEAWDYSIAKTCYFYKMSYSEVEQLDCETFSSLYQSITIIEAQEMLKHMQISDYPHLKAPDRKRIYKELTKQAYPTHLKQHDIVKSEDAAEWIQGC